MQIIRIVLVAATGILAASLCVSSLAAQTIPDTIVLKKGQSWSGRVPATRQLELIARINFPKVAGAASSLDILVEGRRVIGPLRNKGPTFTFADGRSFPYYDAKASGWVVFYSPDFGANNSAAGSGYRVLTNPGQAYRYVWDISALLDGSPTMQLQINNIGSGLPDQPTVIRLVSDAVGRTAPTPAPLPPLTGGKVPSQSTAPPAEPCIPSLEDPFCKYKGVAPKSVPTLPKQR